MNRSCRWVHRIKLVVVVSMLVGLMVTPGLGDSDLESWSAAWVDDGSPVSSESADAEEARKQLLPLLERAVPDSIKSLQLHEPMYSGTNGEAGVWSMMAEKHGRCYTLGGRQEDDKWHPVYFLATGYPSRSGASFDEALQMVSSVVLTGKTDGIEVRALRSLSRRELIRLETWHRRSVEAPWKEYWVFMVDDAPLANWAHPCRYVFVAPDLSAVAVRYALTPLSAGAVSAPSLDGINEMETVIPFIPNSGCEVERKSLPAPRSDVIHYDGDVSNCYAVIVSGGYDKENNHIRYWNDAAFVYSTLTLKYGYSKTNIYALISDGLDPAVDRSDDTNSPSDLDGDGQPDTYGSATAVNVSNVFALLKGQLQTNDQLLVFLTDHGGPTEGGDSWDVELNLWNMEVLRDVELKAFTEDIACPVLFAMEQCYSGGFLNDLNQTNRAIATAAYYNESSYAGDTYPGFDQWAYHWTAAMRGFYPQTNAPWMDAEPCDGDLNDDGFVSFKEAYEYAYSTKYDMDHPMYDDHPFGLGKRMFFSMPVQEDVGMGEFIFHPVETEYVARAPFPVRISAQNVFGVVMTNYTGSAVLRAEALPIDPGRYIGTNVLQCAYPFYTYYMDARTQIIYPVDLMGEARTLDHLQMEIVDAPPIPLSNWTIRLKHTALNAYSESPSWESSGWTVVYESNLVLSTTGWVTFAFSQPFEYDGAQNLMVDFSFFNDHYDESGVCRVSEATNYVSIYFCSDNEFGDPLSWEGEAPAPERSKQFPNLRFGPPAIPVSVQVEPVQTAEFTDGVWTGMVRLSSAAANVRLWASDVNNPWHASSDWFTVLEHGATHYVDAAGTNPVSPYLAWETAATDIQDAIDAADDGDLVLVTDGVYAAGGAAGHPVANNGLTNRVALYKPIIVRSVNGPEVTVIRGSGPIGTEAVRCAYIGTNAVLEGFMLTGGATHTNAPLEADSRGGGVYGLRTDSVVSNCLIVSNSAGYGGGVCGGTSQQSVLSGNSCVHQGGGAYLSVLEDCLVSSNQASVGGGVASSALSRCRLESNVAFDAAGGAQESTLRDCLLIDNVAHGPVGGASNSDLASCTVSRNTGGSKTGGLEAGTAHNCVLHGNRLDGDEVTEQNWCTSNMPLMTYTCTWPLPPDGEGNIAADPRLTADCRLESDSPCVNTGTNESWMADETDLAGSNRIQNAVVDMGAYESTWWGMHADVDVDGFTDWTEVNVTGTDPESAASLLEMMDGEMTEESGGGILVRWQSVAGRLYNVYRATNLVEIPAFTNILSDVTGLPYVTSITDTTATAEVPYFYRVGIEP